MIKSSSRNQSWHKTMVVTVTIAAAVTMTRTASAQMLGNIFSGSNGTNATSVAVTEPIVGAASSNMATIGPGFATTVSLGVAALDSLTATLNSANAPGALTISEAGTVGVNGSFSTDKVFTGVNLTINTPYQFTLTKSAETQIGLLGTLTVQVSVGGVAVQQTNLLNLFTANTGNTATVNFTTPATLNPAGPLEITLSGTTTAGLLGGAVTFNGATFNQVPEPGAWVFLCVGLGLLGGAQRLRGLRRI